MVATAESYVHMCKKSLCRMVIVQFICYWRVVTKMNGTDKSVYGVQVLTVKCYHSGERVKWELNTKQIPSRILGLDLFYS